MLETILVPVDGSEHAGKAAAVAGDLAARHDARVILLFVVQNEQVTPAVRHYAEVEKLAAGSEAGGPQPRIEATPHGPAPIVVTERPARSDRAVAASLAEQVLTQSRQVAGKHGARNIETRTMEGDPAHAILERAKTERADAIVMGSRGLSDFQGVLIGSVSHKVAHRAPCTCITVH